MLKTSLRLPSYRLAKSCSLFTLQYYFTLHTHTAKMMTEILLCYRYFLCTTCENVRTCSTCFDFESRWLAEQLFVLLLPHVSSACRSFFTERIFGAAPTPTVANEQRSG